MLTTPKGAFLLSGILIFAHSQSILEKFHQNDYKIDYTRAETVSFDKSYMKYVNSKTFKYNRTFTASNISFEYVVDLNHDVDVVFQAYKLASNEYRTFPVRFRVNFCLVLTKNSFGMGNAMKTETGVPLCPMKKNVKYFSNYFHPDESKFPPLIPTGEYKVEATFMIQEKDIGVQNFYGRVYRPIKIPN